MVSPNLHVGRRFFEQLRGILLMRQAGSSHHSDDLSAKNSDSGSTATIDRMMTEFLQAQPVHDHPICRHTGCKVAKLWFAQKRHASFS